MTDHTMTVTFNATSSCSNIDVKRDLSIIHRMALAICTAETTIETLPLLAVTEATRVYLMINAMRLALEEEILSKESFKQVS